jgi:ParB family transcriptional regulator, chromosome partitioning protein
MGKRQTGILGKAKEIFGDDDDSRLYSSLGKEISGKEIKVFQLSVDKIFSNPDQPRKHFDEERLSELAQSIIDRGLLQPIIVKKDGPDKFLLIAGERRFRAYKKARDLADTPEDYRLISSVIRDDNELELAMIENVQREDLYPLEEAEGLALLLDRFGYNHDELAKKINKSRFHITELIALTRLPDQIKQEVRSTPAKFSKSILLLTARKKEESEMLSFWEKVKSGEITTTQSKKKKETEKPPVGRPRKNKAEVFMEKLDKAQQAISLYVDTNTTTEEHAQITQNLISLREEIDKKLDSLVSNL